MRRRNLPEVRHCDAGTLAMPRVLAAILGSGCVRSAPPAEPWRIPVPSPRFLCPVCDVEWNGPDDCWNCPPQPQPSQLEES